MEKFPVYIKHQANYDDETLSSAVEGLMERCGVFKSVKPGIKIAVKPNLLLRSRPEQAAITHPAVVKAVVLALKKHGATDILVGDSPGGPFMGARMNDIYKTGGLLELEQIEGVSLLRKATTITKRYEIDGAAGEFELVQELVQADILINLAKMKTHSLAGYTGAVKNLFGCIPGLTKAEMHGRMPDKDRFCEMLCRLAQLVAPRVSILDGVVGMEGDGPSGGEPRAFGLLAASESAFCLDVVIAEYMGFSTAEAKTVGRSQDLGIAPRRSEIAVLGDAQLVASPLGDVKRPKAAGRDFTLRVPKIFQGITNFLFRKTTARPVIRTRDCIGCRRCSEICPKHVITIENKKAEIKPKDCIRCFCCHEVCPEKAIDIKRSMIWRA